MAKRYCLRKPSGRSKRYSIYKQIDLDDGTTKNETLSLKEVDSINQNFESKIIDAPTAEKNIKKIMRKLYADDGRHLPKEVNNTDNYRVLDEYWKRDYESRDLIDRDTAYSALRRAIDALGDIPILSAPVQDIQKQIDSQFSGNKQRRIVEKLSQLLKFIGRPELRLRKNRPQRYKVFYLTEGEMTQVLLNIKEPELKLLTQVCFYTGCRVGEAFALTDHMSMLHPNSDRIVVFRNREKQWSGVEFKINLPFR